MTDSKLKHFLKCSRKVVSVCNKYNVKVQFWVPRSSGPYLSLKELKQIGTVKELRGSLVEIWSPSCYLIWGIDTEEEILADGNFCNNFESVFLLKLFS